MTALDDTTAMASSASSSIGSPVLDGSSVARSISKTLPRSISDVIRARLEAAKRLTWPTTTSLTTSSPVSLSCCSRRSPTRCAICCAHW